MDPNSSQSSTIADPLLATSPNSPSTPSYLDLDRQEPTSQFQRQMENDDGSLLYPSPAKKMRTFKDDKDIFCWICHKDKSNISCCLCVRSFHLKCLPGNSVYSGQDGHGSANGDSSRWVCVECNAIQKAEEAKTRSEALKSLTPDEFAELLKFAVQTIKQSSDVTFHQPVSETQFPDYKELIIHPMDFATIEKNIRAKMYGCTESLLADVKWILHNCHIFNNHNHPLTNNAKYFFKVAKNEMAEIEVCPNCFKNFYKVHQDKWFQQPCQKPHALVWARLKGHPFWPAKVVRIDREKNEVDARFFGAHDRAWVPLDQCFEISEYYSWNKPGKGQKTKFEAAMTELEAHIAKIKVMFPNKFKYAPPKTQLNINKLFICGDSDEDDDSDDKSDKPLVIEELDSIDDSREFEKPSQTKVNNAFNDDLSTNDASNMSATEDERFVCTSLRTPAKSDQKSISEQKCLSPKLSITVPPPKRPKIKIGKGLITTPIKKTVKSASPAVAAIKDDSKQLRDEISSLKNKLHYEQIMHEEQLREVKHNHSIVIKEMRCAMEADKTKALKDAEEVHRRELDAVKRKQWCAFCLSESIYFCCWNTSYCSYNCQSKHWPKHMSECQQQQQQNQQKSVPPKTQSHLTNANQQ